MAQNLGKAFYKNHIYKQIFIRITVIIVMQLVHGWQIFFYYFFFYLLLY